MEIISLSKEHLDGAALRDYQRQGLQCCSVDFKSFNPEAAHFWMKYFEPVRLSLVRRPES